MQIDFAAHKNQVIADAKRVVPHDTPKTHDYTWMGWGHRIDVTQQSISTDGMAKVLGLGLGVQLHDYILIKTTLGHTAKFQITKIKYFTDPVDMWSATLKFETYVTEP